jgi:V8-like Glu-specific endopeptidase
MANGQIVRNTPPTLYPPRPDTMPPGGNEALVDPASFLEAICGASTDWQPVEQYDGTLGVTVGFVGQHQSRVGQIQWNFGLGNIYNNPGNVAGERWCTGTLISEDLFLTAGHCFDTVDDPLGWQVPKDNATGQPISPAEIASTMHVNFNFQVDPAGNPRQEQQFPILSLDEHRLGGLDFAVIRLDGHPGAIFGSTEISAQDADMNSMLCIIQHPAGIRKVVEAGPTTDLQGNEIGYNDLDTLGGSSGSGVLSAPLERIVGVHVLGGCGPNMGAEQNHGVRISAIIQSSPIVQGLAIS